MRLQPTLRIFFRCRGRGGVGLSTYSKPPHLRFPAMPWDGMILYCRYGTPYC